jgi:hypothetical protein
VSPTIGAGGRQVREAFASSPGGGWLVADGRLVSERPHLMPCVFLARLADMPAGCTLRRVLDVPDRTQSGHRLGSGNRRNRARILAFMSWSLASGAAHPSSHACPRGSNPTPTGRPGTAKALRQAARDQHSRGYTARKEGPVKVRKLLPAVRPRKDLACLC